MADGSKEFKIPQGKQVVISPKKGSKRSREAKPIAGKKIESDEIGKGDKKAKSEIKWRKEKGI